MELTKAEARSTGQAYRASISKKQHSDYSRLACAACVTFLQEQNARTVSIYQSFGDELNTEELESALVAVGINVFVQSREPRFPDMQFDAVVIPLSAVDTTGNRVGYGHGHYDAFLAKQKNAITIGMCFSGQIMEHIGSEEHDVRMDYIACEHGVTPTR